MSDQTTAAPQADQVAPQPQAEPQPAEVAAPEAEATEAVPSEEPSKGGDELTKAAHESEAPVKVEDVAVEGAAVSDAAPAVSAPADETKEELAQSDKVEEMVTDRMEPTNEKLADESVEVKMETSISEEKPADEKVTDVTNASESTTQSLQPPPPPSSQQAAENKEPAAGEAKPAQLTIEQPQPPKQPQSSLPTRQYLDATVVPILHSALSQLAKVRPEDPIHFLGTYLLEYKDTFAPEQK